MSALVARVDQVPFARDMAESVAAQYLVELSRAHRSLVATPDRASQRRKHAREVLLDVLATLEHRPELRPTEHTSPHILAAAFLIAGITGRESVEAARILFEVCFTELIRTGKWNPAQIASALSTHIFTDIGEIIHEKRLPTPSNAPEVLDDERVSLFLSRREAAVLDLVVANASTMEIAAQLGIAEHTVKHHITNMGRKLDARGRPKLIARARELGLLVATPVAVSGTIAALSAII